MNRAAVGLGSWLLQGAQGGRTISLDAPGALLECESYARWGEERLEQDAAQGRDAMRALVREVWRGELDGRERHVLRGLLLEGKSENELARELGLHHSAVGRCRRRAEEKLRGGLHYVMRYMALLEQTAQD
ncbi:MAG: hypothetical protein LBB75_02715 [Oscillospiraceae bacterium]|nr:hypothetical protein [Oscillospiraceae bacterium]